MTTISLDHVPAVERLRLTLRADALLTAVNGAAYLAAAGPLEDLLGTPAGLLRGVGAFLLVFALFVWRVSGGLARPAVAGVIAVNALWVVDSVLYAALTSLETAGTVWVLLQAAVVAGLAVSAWAAGRAVRP